METAQIVSQLQSVTAIAVAILIGMGALGTAIGFGAQSIVNMIQQTVR